MKHLLKDQHLEKLMLKFDWKFYTSYYQDLDKIPNEKMAKYHFKNFGFKEGRICFKPEINVAETNVTETNVTETNIAETNVMETNVTETNVIKKDIYDISIVMSYYNRKEQTLRTLNGFEKQYAGNYDFEVIIVDDNSNDENNLNEDITKFSFPINLIVISAEEKGDRINPCVAYNKGFKEAKGNIIVIQNPECYHVGNIIGYTLDNLTEQEYFSYSCYSANNFEITDKLLNNSDPYELIKNVEFNSINFNIINLSWYNHPIEQGRNVSYHFCSAIYKSKLDLIGGFDENFSDGYCFDDDELLLSIKYNLQLDIKIIHPDKCFVIHQYHKRNDSFNIDKEKDTHPIKQKWLKNKKMFEEMKYYHEDKKFNYPKLLHLYWDGSPLSYLNFITVLSFNDYHKFWKINVFVPTKKTENISWTTNEQKEKYTGTCYFNKLYDIPNVFIHQIDLEQIGFYNDASEVIKSDYFRYYILQKHGGLWSDFDIIYYNNLETICKNTTNTIIFQNSNKTYPYCIYYPIGMFISKSCNVFFKYILNKCKEYYNKNDYQCIGCSMFNKLFVDPIINTYKGQPYDEGVDIFNNYVIDKFNKNEVSICNSKLYCPFDWDKLEDMINLKVYDFKNPIIGIHWYNGSAYIKDICNKLDKSLTTYKISSHFFNLIQKYIKMDKFKILLDNKIKLIQKINLITPYLINHEFFIANCFNKLNKINISIVMTTNERIEQTYFTLKIINQQSKDKNVQVIIVDDSINKLDINILKTYKNIQINFISITNKDWINPCVNYNIGFKFIEGKTVVIQNAEVCYVGNFIDFILKINFYDNNSYFVFDVKNSVSFEKNTYIYENIELLKNIDIYNNKNIFSDTNVELWYQNAKLRNYGMHFCSCINSDMLYQLGGFGYDCCYGTDYDDNDFLLKIMSNKCNNTKFIPISHEEYNIGGIHLHHTKHILNSSVNIRNNELYLFKLLYYIEFGKQYIEFNTIQTYNKYKNIYTNTNFNYDFEVFLTKKFYSMLKISKLEILKLTILIPTVPSRLNYFYPKIMNELIKQTENRNDVEIIALFDNKKRTIGVKRQEMLNMAKGEYVTFIDDDDRISFDYIEQILKALYANENIDCIVYNVICCIDNGKKKLCKYGIEYEYGDINENEWRGKPSHTMIWKRTIAINHKYSNLQNGEDSEWVIRACKDINTQVSIDKVLYYYDANYSTTTETGNLTDDTIKKNVNKLLNESNIKK